MVLSIITMGAASPVCRQTHTSEENITFPQLRWRLVKILIVLVDCEEEEEYPIDHNGSDILRLYDRHGHPKITKRPSNIIEKLTSLLRLHSFVWFERLIYTR